MVAGEQWEAELPDLGKVLVLIPFSTLTLFDLDYNKENSITVFSKGLITEMRRTMMMVLKLGKKTITIMMKFNQDFLVQVILPNFHEHENCTVL